MCHYSIVYYQYNEHIVIPSHPVVLIVIEQLVNSIGMRHYDLMMGTIAICLSTCTTTLILIHKVL